MTRSGEAASGVRMTSTAQPIRAALQYVKPTRDGEELFVYKYELPEGVTRPSNLEVDEVEVDFTDLRAVKESFDIVRNGFQLEALEVPDDMNWDVDSDIEERYYPLVERLLKRVAGASRVHIFDHTIRKAPVNSKLQQQQQQQQQHEKGVEAKGAPVSRVHVDYTTKSGPIRLKAALPDEAEQLMKTPFAVIQVWRPLRGPVQDSPLGMLDATTVQKEDLMSYSLHFPGRTGYNYTVQHKLAHRWYYAKGIDVNEAYVFVCYDSRAAGRARFTPHTGFADPSTALDALPRQSIEARAFVFWEHLPQQDVAPDL